ncbi:histidine phosphatase family protein [Kineococcus gynurae]|uniref:Histidine phosphatase family protein n=1 Tax=Kineococcus gynurae TaxID=452979 RepID=A0ABV5LNS7_9ACTN
MSIYVVRHGQTEWSVAGRHTGTTDIPLTPTGERQAAALRPVFADLAPRAVLVSPRHRARRTAELAGLAATEVCEDLAEWDYGDAEGRTTTELSAERGREWSVWADGVGPGATPGETVEAVAERAGRVLHRATSLLRGEGESEAGVVVLVAHGHLLRILTATWLGLEPRAGQHFALDAGTWGELGREHGRPVLSRWSVPPVL